MALRDLFGGNSTPFKLPSALGTEGQVLSVQAGSKTLTWAPGAEYVGPQTFNMNGVPGSSGVLNLAADLYRIGSVYILAIQNVTSTVTFSATNGYLTSSPGVFAAIAPAAISGSTIAFQQLLSPTPYGSCVWHLTPTGTLYITPLAYDKNHPLSVIPGVIIWHAA